MGAGGQSGVFGPTTRDAVTAWQRAHGIAATGEVGPTTWSAILKSQSANGTLFDKTSRGASAKTAKQQGAGSGGVSSSERMADQDLQRLLRYKDSFLQVGSETGLPPALLAAMASRETRGGNANLMRADGYSALDGHGFGIMQIDRRYHATGGDPGGVEHVRQSAKILQGMLAGVEKRFPTWSEADQLMAAVSAYNGGLGVLQDAPNTDRYTTGGDYANDIWARARRLAPHFGGLPATSSPGGATPSAGTSSPAAPAQSTVNPPAAASAPTTSTPSPSGSAVGAAVASGKVFQRGDSGAEVLEIQRRLGMSGEGLTGQFGPTTEGYVRAFQAREGIQSNGRVGPDTWAALERAAGGATPAVPSPSAGPLSQSVNRPTAAPASGASGASGARGANGTVPMIDQHRLPSSRNWAYCGIATVGMALAEAGKPINLQDSATLNGVAGRIYIEGSGTSGSAMAALMRDKGVRDASFTQGGTVSQMVARLQAGSTVPMGVTSLSGVVVALPQPSARYPSLKVGDRHRRTYGPSGHWVLVVGFEGDPKKPTAFLINDPDSGAKLRMSRSELETASLASQGIWMVSHGG
jgi:peptidoglycan hydrolase-like protein with peptidoglycan-binding domain